jgi:hypothetical protein
MTLDGYLVEAGVPILGLGIPGRNEVDAIGVRYEGTNLEIMHVEVGVNPFQNQNRSFALARGLRFR